MSESVVLSSDKLVASTEELSADDTFIIQIDDFAVIRPAAFWIPLLVAAAKALAVALAQRVGERAGDALMDAILGRTANNSAFQNQVLALLDTINSKLDEVLDLLQRLPAQIDRDAIKRDMARGREQLETLKSDLLLGKLSEVTAAFMADHADRLRETVLPYLKQREYFMLGVECLTLTVAAYSRILKLDKGYAPKLIALARHMRPLFASLVDSSPSSFATEKKQLQARLDRVHRDVEQVKTIAGEFAIGWFGAGDSWTPLVTSFKYEGLAGGVPTVTMGQWRWGEEFTYSYEGARNANPASDKVQVLGCFDAITNRNYISRASANYWNYELVPDAIRRCFAVDGNRQQTLDLFQRDLLGPCQAAVDALDYITGPHIELVALRTATAPLK
jgi:hypothetical protein